jgi:ATP-dependent helicase/nuclease subunit B
LSYNAGMGTSGKTEARMENPEIAGWLRSGGLVVAASERARRALTASFHRARRAEGLSAWAAPEILDWQTFLRTEWEKRTVLDTGGGRLLLNPAQEKAIWAEIAGSEKRLATLLNGPRNRVAALAMQAHQLLCAYAPQFLLPSKRSAWQQDAGIFSGWLAVFDEACDSGHLLSPSRLPLELIAVLESESEPSSRPPLLLAGFDRILPVQQRLLDLWGTWKIARLEEPAGDIRLYRAADGQSELAACALWCRQKLEDDQNAKLLVISQEVAQRRGEFERVFLSLAATQTFSPLFEFSLGIPLSKVALIHGAFLLLRWLTTAIEENELDWLFSSGLAVADAQESTALQSFMRMLRRRGLERPEWSLQAFLNQPNKVALPSSWINRMLEAQRRLNEQGRTRKSPLDWAEFAPGLLQIIGWPGVRPLSSEEFQVVRRWELALESCASLGFDGRRITWSEFLLALSDALGETLFAPESREAPIQIAGPAESAGLTADAIWFMGASEDAWPAAGATHPLLPLEIQRDFAMPHATSQLDWELSQAVINRLLSSAPQVCFSYARQGDDSGTRPSRIVVRASGEPQAMPPELVEPPAPAPGTIAFDDFSRIAFPGHTVAGGASVLTYQSQCPFKAFASARLGAQSWSPAEPCLTAAQRGQLLHAVLHSIWGGAETGGIRKLSELKALENREAFIATHVSRATQSELKRSVRERLPERYLELEERRLNSLIGEWLEYELTRADFSVLQTEDERTIEIAGLSIDLRLDRVDRLSDGTLLVIDYKTGMVSTKSWEPPRPDDVQLPLYASFALMPDEPLGGLAFAKVRRGDEMEFAGHLYDARANLDPALRGTSSLVKNKLDEQMIKDWKREIETLAYGFLSGRADVDPRDYPKTCERCGLQALCRIQEHRIAIAEDQQGSATDEEVQDE